jgi:hypothetical protein
MLAGPTLSAQRRVTAERTRLGQHDTLPLKSAGSFLADARRRTPHAGRLGAIEVNPGWGWGLGVGPFSRTHFRAPTEGYGRRDAAPPRRAPPFSRSFRPELCLPFRFPPLREGRGAPSGAARKQNTKAVAPSGAPRAASLSLRVVRSSGRGGSRVRPGCSRRGRIPRGLPYLRCPGPEGPRPGGLAACRKCPALQPCDIGRSARSGARADLSEGCRAGLRRPSRRRPLVQPGRLRCASGPLHLDSGERANSTRDEVCLGNYSGEARAELGQMGSEEPDGPHPAPLRGPPSPFGRRRDSCPNRIEG